MKSMLFAIAVLVVAAGTVGAQDLITCKGSITSIQGEGLVAREHRFDVSGVTGIDIMTVLGKCKRIALERQNQAARRNPGGNFRKFSKVELQCEQGGQHFPLMRVLQTLP